MTDNPLAEVYQDLGGVTEIANDLGVKITRVRRWIMCRETTQCPEPVRILSSVHVYSMVEWRSWYRWWRVSRRARLRKFSADATRGGT